MAWRTKYCDTCMYYGINWCKHLCCETTRGSKACKHYSIKPTAKVCGMCARFEAPRSKYSVVGCCKQMTLKVTYCTPACYWFALKNGSVRLSNYPENPEGWVDDWMDR